MLYYCIDVSCLTPAVILGTTSLNLQLFSHWPQVINECAKILMAKRIEGE